VFCIAPLELTRLLIDVWLATKAVTPVELQRVASHVYQACSCFKQNVVNSAQLGPMDYHVYAQLAWMSVQPAMMVLLALLATLVSFFPRGNALLVLLDAMFVTV